MGGLRHEELTYSLNGWIYQVRRDLKTGWSEEEYHQALLALLRGLDVPVQSKVRKSIFHRDAVVHTFECDLLVWDLIILELKALISTEFAPAHLVQLIGYLKCWHKDLGILVNFGSTKAITKRIIWDEPNFEPYEHYDSISSRMSQSDRVLLQEVCQCLLSIGRQYGIGYPETMYRKIIEIEMAHLGIACQPNAEIPCIWQNQHVGTQTSTHLLVDGQYLLCVRALLERPSKRDYAQMKTYLNARGLQFGLIANFGKQRLQIYGVNNF